MASSIASVRSQTLSNFKRILKEIHLQYSPPSELTKGKGLLGINIHANKEWTDALKDSYRKHANETDSKRLERLRLDGGDLAIYLESQRQHRELVERYNPSFWNEEKGLQVEKTAGMVGFQMPESFDESLRNEELKPMPRFTNKDNKKAAEAAATVHLEDAAADETEASSDPKKRTYKIPKAFGFDKEAEDDLGRPGDRKFE
ncbi:hypothetical protein BGW38_003321 [Lunasporangiospora selenospora]|uniref:Uncharacterized protein n=1 Tax=Lunasporangiospora selenospora TaxID=979761 RepID=A0A9P6G2U2_9FUNG|nr:hypothetical protein BGW38_003321 [Lunasporangiospora selenospora]